LNFTKNNLRALKIKITNFISGDQPGFVECKFSDAWGKKHIVQDKVPIVTEKHLDADSYYPQDGFIACELLKERKDQDGRKIFTITTERPWAVDTIDGLMEFDVTEDQLIELNDGRHASR
jgi:hypothetical protein